MKLFYSVNNDMFLIRDTKDSYVAYIINGKYSFFHVAETIADGFANYDLLVDQKDHVDLCMQYVAYLKSKKGV